MGKIVLNIPKYPVALNSTLEIIKDIDRNRIIA